MMIAQLTAVLESIGNTYGTGAAVRREITHKHLSGAISVDGIGSIVAPLLNGFPLTCFAQNIGVISITRVASRYVVASAGVVLIALGLIPKFSALVAGMPAPVLGGASLIMFGSIVGSGVAQIKDSGPFDQRAAMVFQPLSHSDWGLAWRRKTLLMPFRHRWSCSWSRVWRLVEWRQLY